MRRGLRGGVLSPAGRERSLGWLRACEEGRSRLRRPPPSWIAGDKTGSGGHSMVNEVTIAWPPGRAPSSSRPT